MRYVNLALCLLMLVFVAVQLNDPDGAIWILIYLVPAAWTALAALRGAWLASGPPRWLLSLCIVVALYGVFHYWPDTPQWWAKEVWYEVETAREGMGMMIVVIVLLVVWFSTRLRSGRRSTRG